MLRTGLQITHSLRRSYPVLTQFKQPSSQHYSTILPKTCPSCHAPLPTPLPACLKCRFIAPVPNDVRKHEVFGLEYQPDPFTVDTKAVRQTFRRLQQVVHPDLWSNTGKQNYAEQLSAYVNESYKTLLDPVARAQYILAQQGILVGEEGDRVDDSEFMGYIFERRMTLEEVQTAEEAEAVRRESSEQSEELMTRLSNSIREKKWVEAKDLTVRLKYLNGIIKTAEEWRE